MSDSLEHQSSPAYPPVDLIVSENIANFFRPYLERASTSAEVEIVLGSLSKEIFGYLKAKYAITHPEEISQNDGHLNLPSWFTDWLDAYYDECLKKLGIRNG